MSNKDDVQCPICGSLTQRRNVDEILGLSELAPARGSAISITMSQENLQNRAKKYVMRVYGKPGQGNDEDKWMERFGLLCAFIDELFSPNDKLSHGAEPLAGAICCASKPKT